MEFAHSSHVSVGFLQPRKLTFILMFNIRSILNLYLEVWWCFYGQKFVVGMLVYIYQLTCRKNGFIILFHFAVSKNLLTTFGVAHSQPKPNLCRNPQNAVLPPNLPLPHLLPFPHPPNSLSWLNSARPEMTYQDLPPFSAQGLFMTHLWPCCTDASNMHQPKGDLRFHP